MILPTQGIRILGTRISSCLFQHQFQINVGFGALGNQLIAPHVNRERLAAPYYTNLLEIELLLHLGDSHLQHMTEHLRTSAQR
jgi:hypothetical protein